MELAPSGRPVDQILADAVDGRRISAGDAHTLVLEGDLIELGLAADSVRNRFNDRGVATYNIDRNINYTNVCVYKCRFCAFYRPPGDSEGYLLPFEEIARKIEETLALNGTGILMQGGVHPDLPIDYYEELLSRLRERFPEVHLHAFSPPEVKFVAKKERLSFYEVIRRLKEAGLMSIPGGGAELLSDGIRKEVLAYAKTSSDEWIDIMRQAHRNGLRTSSTMMYGMGEELVTRIEHLARIRDLQDETGGFTAFISWTFQHDHTDMEHVPETFAHEYLKTLAVSRLFIDNIRHFQTSWVTQGKKIGQLGLKFGADDMGSIMIEENVVSAAGTSYRMSQDEMEHLIASAGYEPRQRTNLYERQVSREDTAELAERYRGAADGRQPGPVVTPAGRHLGEGLPLPDLRYVLNPAAGGGRGAGLRERLLSEATRSAASLVESRGGGHLTELARQAVAAGVRRLVVAGGDGTFHHVIQGLAGTSTELACLSVGTGNDLASSLGLPRDLESGLELARGGAARSIDLGRVGERWFAIYAGVGFDSEVGRWVTVRGSAGKSKSVYIRGVLTNLLRFVPPRIDVEHDGGTVGGEAMFVTVANCFRFGGGMKIAPAADPADGRLDLVYVRRISKLRLLGVFPRVFSGTHVGHPAITIESTTRARIQLDREMVMYADGEAVGPVGPDGVDVRIRPAALSVAKP